MNQEIPAQAVEKLIAYYCLLSYCPPRYVEEFRQACREPLSALAGQAGLTLDEFLQLGIPQAARRMVCFHMAARNPDEEMLANLVNILHAADRGPREGIAFQEVMDVLARHQGRAKGNNRLHREKGCAFCLAPCRYGLFTLVTEPDFTVLKTMLDAENKKLAHERDAVSVLWAYTRRHVLGSLGSGIVYLKAEHLGNLSYCLLLLGTARSRFALPEAQLIRYQDLSLGTMRRLNDRSIRLA